MSLKVGGYRQPLNNNTQPLTRNNTQPDSKPDTSFFAGRVRSERKENSPTLIGAGRGVTNASSKVPADSQASEVRTVTPVVITPSRLNAGSGASSVSSKTPVVAQAPEVRAVTPVKDINYYLQKAAREAIENIRGIAKNLNRPLVVYEDKVFINTGRMARVENKSDSLIKPLENVMVLEDSSGNFRVYAKESCDQKEVLNALKNQGHKFGIDIRKIIEFNIIKDELWGSLQDRLSLIDSFRAKYPHKEIKLYNDQASMAEAIARESEDLREAFPSQEKAVSDCRSLSENEGIFYNDILNGVGFAFFVPKSASKTVEALKPLKLHKTIKQIEKIEGERITNTKDLCHSRIVIQQINKISRKYADAAFLEDREALIRPEKRKWSAQKVAEIATTTV